MKRTSSDIPADTAIKRTKFKCEADEEHTVSHEAFGNDAKGPFFGQAPMQTVGSHESAEDTAILALTELSSWPSFVDSAEIVRSLDDLLERGILSSEIIDHAVDMLLRMAAEIDEEIYPSYRVEHIYSLLCKFANRLTCASPRWQNVWDALEQCPRNSALCSARLCCLLSLTHLAIQRREWLRQSSDAELTSVGDVQKSIETLLAKHMADYDHRVRIRALDCLMEVQQLGLPLMLENYNRVCQLVDDQNGSVRSRAYKLIVCYAKLYPEKRIPSNCQSVRLRLVDHAFSKICYAMQDVSVFNRVEAAKLLGQFRGVSDKFLEQTLDKKLLKQMKMQRDSSVDTQSSEWATGRMFGADAPAELLDGSYVPLIDAEACGAFIAGLEDEHMDVRNASIDSVSSLAMENKEFAQKCLDFLVDMFNDEIDEVRLNAIKHLARLCPFVTVGDEQLRSIYNGLVDSSPDGREAIREVLACCRLESSFCLELTLNALTNNLTRNPEDKLSVWNCAKQLGSKLSGLVLPLTCELLALHPYYEGTEPKLNDPCYIAKLILVVNAAKHCPTITSCFLNYTWNHYEYLRVNCPTLVPVLRASRPGFLPLPLDPTQLCQSESQRFEQCLDAAEHALKEACNATTDERRELFKSVAEDLQLLSDEGLESSGTCECTLHCVRLANRFEEIIQHFDKSCFLDSAVGEAAAETFKMATELAFVWKGGEQLSRFASEIQLRAAFLLAAVLDFLHNVGDEEHEREVALLPPVHTVIKYALRLNAPSLEIFAPFVMVHSEPDGIEWKVGLRTLVDAMKENPLHPTVIRESVVRLSAVITEPSDNVVYRFAGSLILAVPLAANLYGFAMEDVPRLRIRLIYPDTTVKLFKPRKNDFTDFLPAFIRLRTNVLLTAPAWTESAPVELSVALLGHRTFLLDDKMRHFSISNSVTVQVYPKLI